MKVTRSNVDRAIVFQQRQRSSQVQVDNEKNIKPLDCKTKISRFPNSSSPPPFLVEDVPVARLFSPFVWLRLRLWRCWLRVYRWLLCVLGLQHHHVASHASNSQRLLRCGAISPSSRTTPDEAVQRRPDDSLRTVEGSSVVVKIGEC